MKQNAGLAKYLFKKWTKNSKSLYLPEKAKVIWEQREKQPECYKRNHRKNQRKNDAFQKCFYINQSEMNNEMKRREEHVVNIGCKFALIKPKENTTFGTHYIHSYRNLKQIKLNNA